MSAGTTLIFISKISSNWIFLWQTVIENDNKDEAYEDCVSPNIEGEEVANESDSKVCVEAESETKEPQVEEQIEEKPKFRLPIKKSFTEPAELKSIAIDLFDTEEIINNKCVINNIVDTGEDGGIEIDFSNRHVDDVRGRNDCLVMCSSVEHDVSSGDCDDNYKTPNENVLETLSETIYEQIDELIAKLSENVDRCDEPQTEAMQTVWKKKMRVPSSSSSKL